VTSSHLHLAGVVRHLSWIFTSALDVRTTDFRDSNSLDFHYDDRKLSQVVISDLYLKRSNSIFDCL